MATEFYQKDGCKMFTEILRNVVYFIESHTMGHCSGNGDSSGSGHCS